MPSAPSRTPSVHRRRVLIVPAWYHTPDDPFHGVFVREQARLVSAKHDVVILYPFQPGAPRRGPWEVSEQVEDGIPTLRVARRPLAGRDLPQTVAGTRAALRRLRRRGWVPDVVHAHVFSAAAVARMAVGRRIPMVVTEHFTGIAQATVRGVARQLARFAYQSADLVAPVSANLARRIAELGVTTPTRVLPNAVDTTRFSPPEQPRRLDGDGERLLLVGAMVPIKGVPVALEALVLLRRSRPGATLEIVGDGPCRAEYEELARRLGLNGVVHFAGRLGRDEVAERMRASHVLVSASKSENLPGVQLEARASGLPIVATAVGGVPDLVDEEAGVLVPYGDAQALADGIQDVLSRYDQFDGARLAARTDERFGPARVAALWDEVYEDLAAGVSRRRFGQR